MTSTEGKHYGKWYAPAPLIWGYISRALAAPFSMALLVVMFVFLLQFLMRFIDRIVGKGLDLWTILQLIAFNLAWMVVLAVPMAVLVACVMAFGSLSASNEITAMKAAGMSLGRMLLPVLIFGALITVFDFQFNNRILPDANHRAKDLMSDIQRKKPTFAIEPGRFSDDDAVPGYSILARRAVPNTDFLEQVTIYDHSQTNQLRLLNATKAKVAFTPDFRNILLTLFDGEFHEYSYTTPNDYRHGSFSEYVVQVPTNGFDFMRQGESERSDRELSAQDLLQYVYRKDTIAVRYQNLLEQHLTNLSEQMINPHERISNGPATTADIAGYLQTKVLTVQNDKSNIDGIQDDIDSYMVEVHKKYSIPAACLVFVLLGVPLGTLAKRSGVGVGVGLSIGFFVLYWIFLIGGEKLADRNVIAPWVGMWGGNILLLSLGLFLTWRVATEQPSLHLFNNLRSMFAQKNSAPTDIDRKQP